MIQTCSICLLYFCLASACEFEIATGSEVPRCTARQDLFASFKVLRDLLPCLNENIIQIYGTSIRAFVTISPDPSGPGLAQQVLSVQ